MSDPTFVSIVGFVSQLELQHNKSTIRDVISLISGMHSLPPTLCS
jgi:hypothetical protein